MCLNLSGSPSFTSSFPRLSLLPDPKRRGLKAPAILLNYAKILDAYSRMF